MKIYIEVKRCSDCKYERLCKLKNDREQTLDQFKSKCVELFDAFPDWVISSPVPTLIRCCEYKAKQSEYHCRDCVHLVPNPSYKPSGRYNNGISQKYMCTVNRSDGRGISHDYLTSGNTNSCERFEKRG